MTNPTITTIEEFTVPQSEKEACYSALKAGWVKTSTEFWTEQRSSGLDFQTYWVQLATNALAQ